MNQKQKIRELLESGETITSMEAFKKFGCTRLSDKIFKLRNAGYEIASIPCTGTNRYGEECHYVMYRLIKAPKDKDKE